MNKIRWKIDYLKLIREHGFSSEFEDYLYTHQHISEKRAARAFCVKHDLIKFFYWDLQSFFERNRFEGGSIEVFNK